VELKSYKVDDGAVEYGQAKSDSILVFQFPLLLDAL